MKPLTVVINGDKREVPADCSVLELLHHLKLKTEQVAVERNLAVVPRSQYASVKIEAGDALEVVTLVGGG